MKKITLLILLFATAIWCAVVLTKNPIVSDVDTPAQAPVRGGKIVIGISNDADSFNPLFNETASAQEITHLLLLGLVGLDENSEFKPELAESWQFSDDRLKVTFQLRKNIFWSDGVPITAEDVKFTFDLLQDDTVASPRQHTTEYIKEVVVENAQSVTFHFVRAYPGQMFDIGSEILPKHILENGARANLRTHEFGRMPISSGPFQLKKWVSEQFIELVPNERYFEARPNLDRVIFKIVPDKTNLLMQLQTGEIDMMTDVPLAEVQTMRESNPNIRLYPISGRLYYYIGYNQDNSLFANKSIRKALTMAVDRQRIIDALLYGFGEECLGPMPPMVPWAYNPDVPAIPYDPAGARAVLSEHGWQDSNGDGWLDKDGQAFSFKLVTNTGNPLRSDIAVIVQDQLKQVGIKVEIQALERATLIGALREGKFAAFMGGWSTSFNIDPTPIFHSSSTDLFNFVKYNNPRVDHLIEVGREEMDRGRAAEIWQETQQLIYEDQPYTFLFWKARVVAVSKQFNNVTPIPLSSIYGLEHWYNSEQQ